MHELTLACDILELVENAARRDNFRHVACLHLEAGALAGVEVSALRFALESLASGTCLEGAQVRIDEPPRRRLVRTLPGPRVDHEPHRTLPVVRRLPLTTHRWRKSARARPAGPGHLKENVMCAICGCNSHAEASGLHATDRQGQGQGQGQDPGELDAPLTQEGADQHLHFGAGAAGLSVPGMSAARIIKLEANVLGANQRFADANRRHFAAHAVAAYNLVSSPGSGKTTLLCATITALRQHSPELSLAVIEGDQQTDLDAQRIRASGTQAIQINTGRGCHLDAKMVGEAFSRLDLHAHHHATVHPKAGRDNTPRDTEHGNGALLLIENVGNLVCPALWDLGENAKVALLSVTEGDDKPMKYPDMFAAASLMLINKIDLLPYVDFDVERCVTYARRVNPDIAVIQLSATRGDGMDAWLDWLQATTC